MVADKESDDEKDEHNLYHNSIVSSCYPHVPNSNHKDNKDRHNMHINPKQSIRKLTVVVKRTVSTQKLTSPCRNTVGNVRYHNIVYSLTMNQNEKILETVRLL